jgi:hypothetical protein
MEGNKKDLKEDDSSQGNIREFGECYTTESLAKRLNVSKKFPCQRTKALMWL